MMTNDTTVLLLTSIGGGFSVGNRSTFYGSIPAIGLDWLRMKLVTYRGDSGPRAGVLDPAAGTVTDAGAALGQPAGVTVGDLIARWGDVAAPLAAAVRDGGTAGGGAAGPVPLPDVT